MKNNRGLSGIVTTLIIILLVLVAVGVIWQVVGGLLSKSTSTIGSSSKCLDLDIKATKVVTEIAGTYDDDYNITIKRGSSGDEAIGAKVVFFNDNSASTPASFPQMFVPLQTSTDSFQNTGVINATYVEITPFFIDEDTGKEILCSSTSTFEFDL